MKSITYISTVLATIFVLNIGMINCQRQKAPKRTLRTKSTNPESFTGVTALRDDPKGVNGFVKRGKFNQKDVAIKTKTNNDIFRKELVVSKKLVGKDLKNVATVFVATEDYIIMRYYETTLAATIDSSLTLHTPKQKGSIQSAERTLTDIVNALSNLNDLLKYENQVFVHGNLKAANLLMNPGGKIQLSGFGSYKMVAPNCEDRMHDIMSCVVIGLQLMDASNGITRVYDVKRMIENNKAALTQIVLAAGSNMVSLPQVMEILKVVRRNIECGDAVKMLTKGNNAKSLLRRNGLKYTSTSSNMEKLKGCKDFMATIAPLIEEQIVKQFQNAMTNWKANPKYKMITEGGTLSAEVSFDVDIVKKKVSFDLLQNAGKESKVDTIPTVLLKAKVTKKLEPLMPDV